MTWLWILFGILVVFQIIDILTTLTILEKGGRELNSFVKLLMNKFGINAALYGSKAIFIIILIFVLVYLEPNILMYIAFIFLILLYGYVVGHNIKALNRMEEIDKYE